MDLKQMQYFVSLYEEQSITKAARRLNVVQPAVSMQIKRLENEYGVKLFDRTSRGVYPTIPARKLYPICLTALENVSAGGNLLREAAGQITGKISIGIPPSLAHSIIARELITFQSNHPDVRFNVLEGYSETVTALLLQGTIDFAITSLPENDTRLRHRIMITEKFAVVARGDCGIKGHSVSGRDACDLRLILPFRGNFCRNLIESKFNQIGLNITPSMEVESLATVLNLLLNPGWSAIMPVSTILNGYHPEILKTYQLVNPTIERTLSIAADPNKELSPAAELFIAQLEGALMNLNIDGNRPHSRNGTATEFGTEGLVPESATLKLN